MRLSRWDRADSRMLRAPTRLLLALPTVCDFAKLIAYLEELDCIIVAVGNLLVWMMLQCEEMEGRFDLCGRGGTLDAERSIEVWHHWELAIEHIVRYVWREEKVRVSPWRPKVRGVSQKQDRMIASTTCQDLVMASISSDIGRSCFHT